MQMAFPVRMQLNRTIALGIAGLVLLACAASCASSGKPHPGVCVEHPVDTGPKAPLPPTDLTPTPASTTTPAPLCRPPSHAEAFEQRTGLKLSPVEKSIMDDCPPRAWSKNVPQRGCTKDDECGDGFCQKGECASILTCGASYGHRCEDEHHCAMQLSHCSDGRCRSWPISEIFERRLGITLSSLDKTVMDTCPERAWTHNVPKRRCTSDGQCGDGFCDRGRCAAKQTCDGDYGRACKDTDQCGFYFCIDGRCRSCTSERECDWRREYPGEGNITCHADDFIPGSRRCSGSMGSVPGDLTPWSPPKSSPTPTP
jgi:hypothetical protein